MSQKSNNTSKAYLNSEANRLFVDLTPEETSAINGGFGFLKEIRRRFRSDLRAIAEGARKLRSPIQVAINEVLRFR